MQFLAHRGLWRLPAERNTLAALSAAFAGGFGLETDLRDRDGELVIAHDPADGGAPKLAELLKLARMAGNGATLALNIKADGLRRTLQPLLQAEPTLNYFCFDMTVPETLAFHREGFRFFTRESEYKPAPILYQEAAGIWMDMFHSDWIAAEHVRRRLDEGKEVALVSPELHGRAHFTFWTRLREAGLAPRPGLMLCTDLPEAARDFFHA